MFSVSVVAGNSLVTFIALYDIPDIRGGQLGKYTDFHFSRESIEKEHVVLTGKGWGGGATERTMLED